MDIILEIDVRGGKPRLERARARNGVITLGRAYDNDVILADPHVCPHHGELRINDDGSWQYRDLGSVNGSFNQQGQRLGDNAPLRSGDTLQLARLRLRLLSPEHPVAATEPLERWHTLLARMQQPVALTLLLTGIGLLFLYNQSLDQFTPPKWSDWITELFGFSAIVVAWASFWALLGRLIRHEARFGAQLAVAGVLIIASLGLEWLLQLLAFNGASPMGALIATSVGSAVLLGVLIALSLRIAVHADNWQLRAMSHAVAWVTVAFISAQAFQSQFEFSPHPEYISELQPPFMRVVPAVNSEDFLRDAKQALDD